MSLNDKNNLDNELKDAYRKFQIKQSYQIHVNEQDAKEESNLSTLHWTSVQRDEINKDWNIMLNKLLDMEKEECAICLEFNYKIN